MLFLISAVYLAPVLATIQITPQATQSGIYFELGGQLKLVRSSWRILIALDSNNGTMYGHSNDTFLCGRRLMRYHCDAALEKDLTTAQQKVLTNIEKRIRILKEDIYKNNDPTRVNRGVGTVFLTATSNLLRGLFNSISYSDIPEIISHVKTAVDKGKELFFSKRTKTHVAINKFKQHDNPALDDSALNLLHRMLTFQHNVSALEYDQEYTYRTLAILTRRRRHDLDFDLLLRAKQEELDVLTQLQKGIVDHRILSDTIINKIRNDIKTHSPFEIPIPETHFRATELAKISQIDATITNETVIVSLTIPLVDKNTITFYKMHSIPVTQDALNLNLSATIIPSHKFLGVDRQNNLFIKFNDLKTCIETHYGYICSAPAVLRDTNSEDCETSLLLSPKTEIPKTCALRINKMTQNIWTYLEYNAAWFFSLHQPISATLICPNKLDESISMSGDGIANIYDNCILRTDTEIIFNGKTPPRGKFYQYDSKIKLKIDQFLENHYPTIKEHVFNKLRQHLEYRSDIVLTDVIATLNISGENSQHYVILGIVCLLINFFIIILVIIVLLKQQRVFKLKGSKTMHNLPPVTFNTKIDVAPKIPAIQTLNTEPRENATSPQQVDDVYASIESIRTAPQNLVSEQPQTQKIAQIKNDTAQNAEIDT